MFKFYFLIFSIVISGFGQNKLPGSNSLELSANQKFTQYNVSTSSLVEYVAETDMFFLFGSTIIGSNSSVSGVINLDSINLIESTAKVIIKANDFTSGNDSRDEHIAEILNNKTHPEIIFILDSLSKPTSTDQSQNSFLAVGSLTVNGIKKSVSFPVMIIRSSNEIKISGEIEVLYSDFGIEPPTVVGGIVKEAKESILLKASILANKAK